MAGAPGSGPPLHCLMHLADPHQPLGQGFALLQQQGRQGHLPAPGQQQHRGQQQGRSGACAAEGAALTAGCLPSQSPAPGACRAMQHLKPLGQAQALLWHARALCCPQAHAKFAGVRIRPGRSCVLFPRLFS